MYRLLLALLLLVLLSSRPARCADQSLPASLTPEERKFITEHFDEYLRSKTLQRGEEGPLPKDIIEAPGEFGRSDGVIFAWVGHGELLKALIKEVALDAKAFVTVRSTGEESRVRDTLSSYGVNMQNVKFGYCPLNSVWMRDYGPQWIYTKSGSREVIDLIYNRPRPADDKFPSTFAQAEGVAAHKAPLILPGGNLILDGHGVAIMTDIVFDAGQGGNPNMSQAQLEQYMKDYFGVTKVIMLKHMRRDGTGHADMFSKLLNDETFIVGQYASPGDGASGNAKILDENAEKLSHETNGVGRPFKVFRIPMPRYDGTSYTHTNSLIVDNKVLVPIYGSATDEAALNIYRQLMPGAKVCGFDCNSIIGENGAIHCITELVMSAPMTVTHTPGTATAGSPIAVSTTVDSEQAIDPAKAFVYWRTGTSGEFTAVPLTAPAEVRGDYTAALPEQAAGNTVQYYVRVEDVRGMYRSSPADAPTNVHSVTVAPRHPTSLSLMTN